MDENIVYMTRTEITNACTNVREKKVFFEDEGTNKVNSNNKKHKEQKTLFQ